MRSGEFQQARNSISTRASTCVYAETSNPTASEWKQITFNYQRATEYVWRSDLARTRVLADSGSQTVPHGLLARTAVRGKPKLPRHEGNADAALPRRPERLTLGVFPSVDKWLNSVATKR